MAMTLTRRTLIAATAAAVAAPHVAGADTPTAIRSRAAGFDQLHALIILRNGETVLEERFRGPGLDSPANVKSVSKTMVATLLGIAIDKGAIRSVDVSLGEVAPRLIPDSADPRARDIPWKTSSRFAPG